MQILKLYFLLFLQSHPAGCLDSQPTNLKKHLARQFLPQNIVSSIPFYFFLPPPEETAFTVNAVRASRTLPGTVSSKRGGKLDDGECLISSPCLIQNKRG